MPDPLTQVVDTPGAAVAAVLRLAEFRFGNEDELQQGIVAVLEARVEAHVRREVRLGPRDRIDHLLDDGIGIEVKIAGNPERLLRQLERYAAHGEIREIIVVTTRWGQRALPEEVGGKPLHIVYIGAQAL